MVVGADKNSLGESIAHTAINGVWQFESVVTAGITGEQYKMDVHNIAMIRDTLLDVMPDIVVCTVGDNTPCDAQDQDFQLKFNEAMVVNVLGPMEILRQFIKSPVASDREGLAKKFVAISSNSARIARRGSITYCASKAALSMALRCAAREMAGSPVQVWGYEPGLLAGTPMTQQTEAHFGSAGPLHRMIGVDPGGLSVSGLAQRVVNDIADYSQAYNGTIFPFDAGEQ